MKKEFIFAGFGGQGMLLIGKFLAMACMMDGKHVSWLPSYGPEMRGGTANCSVCIDEKPIGCPIVLEPQTLIVMNRPSYDKFVAAVAPGGVMIYDSTLIDAECTRTDITVAAVPATQMANDNGLHGLSNIIMLGQTLKQTGFCSLDVLKEALQKCIPARKQHLFEPNLRALQLGYDYSC